MRAANAVALPSSFPQERPSQKEMPGRPALPSSFQEALKSGWTIVKEESAITINHKRRTGVVLLRLKDALVRIPYEATAKEWVFGKPEPITTE